MSNFNNFAELVVANGAQMNSRVIAMAADGAGVNMNTMSQAHFVQNTVTNNGARATGFRYKLSELWDGKGNIDPSSLELDPKLDAEMGTWNEADIAAARAYFNAVLGTNRWVGKPAKVRAKELLDKLDTQEYQKSMSLDYGEDKGRAESEQKWDERRMYDQVRDRLYRP